MTQKDLENPALWLLNTLAERQKKNASYSLRSFAKQLDISPATLSLVLSGKDILGLKVAEKISRKCDFTDVERERFLSAVLRQKLQIKQRQKNALELDHFRMISDWYHYGILSLSYLEKNQADKSWISRQLDINENLAQEALERLIRLGYIEVQKDKSFVQKTQNLETPPMDIPSEAIRKFHKQSIELNIKSLENDSPEVRDISNMTVAIDPKNIKPAKALIDKFREDMNKLLCDGELTDVYQLSIQLAPITRNFQKEGI